MYQAREEPTCVNCGHHIWDQVDNKHEVFFVEDTSAAHKAHKPPELHFWVYRGPLRKQGRTPVQQQVEIQVVYIIESVNAHRPNGKKAALVQDVYNWPAKWSRNASAVGCRELRKEFLRQNDMVLKELTTVLKQEADS
jgi:hypothetical protein